MLLNFLGIIGVLIGIGILIGLLSQKSQYKQLTNSWRLISIDEASLPDIQIFDKDHEYLQTLIANSYLDLNINGSFRSQFLNTPPNEGLWETKNNIIELKTTTGNEKLTIVQLLPHKVSLSRQINNHQIILHYGL